MILKLLLSKPLVIAKGNPRLVHKDGECGRIHSNDPDQITRFNAWRRVKKGELRLCSCCFNQKSK